MRYTLSVQADITISRLWKHPRIVCNILVRPYKQELEPVFRNAQVLLYTQSKTVISYCVLMERGEYYQLMDVYTFPCFRGMGYATAFLTEVLQDILEPVYLICRCGVAPFYNRVGFVLSANPPTALEQRLRLIHATTGRWFGEHCIMVKQK